MMDKALEEYITSVSSGNATSTQRGETPSSTAPVVVNGNSVMSHEMEVEEEDGEGEGMPLMLLQEFVALCLPR